MRQTSGSMVCLNCSKLIDVNEPACPYCGVRNPGLWGYGPVLRRFLGNLDTSAAIAGACVVLYVIALALDPYALLHPRGLFGILAPGGRALVILGITGGRAGPFDHWWTVVSAIYLHGSLLHILFNVWWVRRLGPEVEEVYGRSRLLIIFTVSGALGFVISNVLSGAPTIGASGSIFGLLAALIVHARRSGTTYMTRQLLSTAGILFLFGLLLPGVNNFAHAGGFAGGWLAAGALGAGLGAAEGSRERWLALACVVAPIAAVLASVVTSGVRFAF